MEDIAGYQRATGRSDLGAVRYERDDTGEVTLSSESRLREISGVAPEFRILSYKVLDDNGVGRTSDVMAALHAIQEVNDNGRIMKIHGVNLSLGYDFDPEWFASKGPTGDGRAKPDLLAPGERILSAASGSIRAEDVQDGEAQSVFYAEHSGTSMAAPLVLLLAR